MNYKVSYTLGKLSAFAVFCCPYDAEDFRQGKLAKGYQATTTIIVRLSPDSMRSVEK